jgi:hypothetical protein
MDWSAQLATGESVLWEARPAPRCYVFRNWRHSLFGLLLLLLSTWWQAVGFQLGQLYDLLWLGWLPLPFVLLGLYLALGHVLLARYEWERVFYAVTDRRVLTLRGLFRSRFSALPLSEVTYFQIRPHGLDLATIRVGSSKALPPLILSCVEHPGRLIALLEAEMAASGALAAGRQNNPPQT